MSTVYIVNHVKDDVSKALSYGELKHVNIRYVYGDEISDDSKIPSDFRKGLDRALVAFNPQTDHLLIAGDHLQLVAFSAMLGKRYGEFRVLRWDRMAEGYMSVLIQV